MNRRQILRASDMPTGRTKQDNYVPIVLERRRNGSRNIIEQTQHTYNRSWIYSDRRCFIVETYVSAGDRRIELPASITHSRDSLLELPVDLRLVRVTEVQTVCNSERDRTRAYNVSCSLGDCNLGTPSGVEVDVPTIAVSCYRESLICFFNID